MANEYGGFNVDVNSIIREEAVIDTIEELFDRLHRHIDESGHPEEARLLAVDSCIASCLDVLDMAYPARHNFPVEEIALVDGSWEPDPEPTPCAVDTWIRGAIPETERQVQPQQQHLADATKSVRDQVSGSITGRARQSGASMSDSADKSLRTPTGLRGPSSLHPVMKKDNMLSSHPDKPVQTKAEERLRNEIKLRKEQAALAQQMSKKDEEARDKLAAIQGHLRGKEYSYDHKGEIIIVNKLDPDKLPSLGGADVQLVLPEGGQAELDRLEAKAASQPSFTAPANDHRHSKPPKKIGTNDFVETASKTQPPLIDTLKVVSGVTVRHGAQVKRGPVPTTKALGQMTRAEFASLAASTRTSTGTSVTAALAVPDRQRQTREAPGSAKHAAADGQYSRAASMAAPQRPVTPDLSTALVSAPDWGSCGPGQGFSAPEAAKPTKPGARMLKEEVGSSGFHPRNRNAAETARSGATTLPKPLAKLRS